MITFLLVLSRFRSGFDIYSLIYLLDETACLSETAAFVQSGEEEKTVIAAVVHVDLPFISSEIANPSHR